MRRFLFGCIIGWLLCCGVVFTLLRFPFHVFNWVLLPCTSNPEYDSGYRTKLTWEDVCWMKALRKADELKNNPNVEKVRVHFGDWLTYMSDRPHAWIGYIETIQGIRFETDFDPTIDRVVRRQRLWTNPLKKWIPSRP